MADRLYSAQIDYPFVSQGDPDYVAGILDALFYTDPEDSFVVPATIPSDIERVGAWLHTREKVGSDYQYIFYVAVPANPTVYDRRAPYIEANMLYTIRTFLVPDAPLGTIITARATEDSRSALTVNNGLIAGGTALHTLSTNVMEPAIVVPCTRTVTQINLYNEYRSSNPADRGSLPPDFLIAELVPGQSLVFNDGFNCTVAYNEGTQTLRFTGGTGIGAGRPDAIPWDDTDEDLEAGIRGINGTNNLGVVPFEGGAGVILDTSVDGELTIVVRDQGDGGCPPE